MGKEVKAKSQGKEIKKGKEEQKVTEQNLNETTAPEMELELTGDELEQEMEPIVKDKIKKEEKENAANKSKPGPKPGSTNKKSDEKKDETPKKKELNLKDTNVIQREIKKGNLAAPQGRIEKMEDGNYRMLLKDGVIFPTDGEWKEFGTIPKMIEGKDVVTLEAAQRFSQNGVFKAKHSNGEEIDHNWVRIELHKPGRDKDVVEIFTIKESEKKLKQRKELENKRQNEKVKKEEKEKEVEKTEVTK